jgi:hypothetical protein
MCAPTDDYLNRARMAKKMNFVYPPNAKGKASFKATVASKLTREMDKTISAEVE